MVNQDAPSCYVRVYYTPKQCPVIIGQIIILHVGRRDEADYADSHLYHNILADDGGDTGWLQGGLWDFHTFAYRAF